MIEHGVDRAAAFLADMQMQQLKEQIGRIQAADIEPLDKEILTQLPKMNFDLSVNCKVANVACCSSSDYINSAHPSNCLLINLVGLPARDYVQVMQKYASCKQNNLAMQTYVIKGSKAVLSKQSFQTMQTVATCGTGDKRRQVLHDPPTISDNMTPCLHTSIAGCAGRLCLDSRSALNCISKEYCRKFKISVQPVPEDASPTVVMANGQQQALTGQCTVQVKTQGYSAYLRLAVLPLAGTHDVILGEP